MGLTVKGKEREREWVEGKKRNEKATIEEEEEGSGRREKKEEIKKDVISKMEENGVKMREGWVGISLNTKVMDRHMSSCLWDLRKTKSHKL